MLKKLRFIYLNLRERTTCDLVTTMMVHGPCRMCMPGEAEEV
jgi:hypothetical protein